MTSINAAGERLTGYTREELLKMNVMQLIAAEYRETARRMLESKLARGGKTTYELEIVNRAGQRIALEICSQVLLRDGKPIGVQGIARDMSERRLSRTNCVRLRKWKPLVN